MPSVLFVCTGNLCRSPMAAALFMRRLQADGRADGWRVESAGTWTTEGLPASQDAIQVMHGLGLDLSGHRSRLVSSLPLAEFDLILVMEQGQREALQVEFPEIAGRVHRLAEMAGEASDIPDPIGKGPEVYRATAKALEDVLEGGYSRILSLAG